MGFTRVQGSVRVVSSVGVRSRSGTVHSSAVHLSDLRDRPAAIVGVDDDFDRGDLGAPL